MKVVDLRSDTVTKPTREMRQAMMDSVVGDDCHGEDSTVNELQDLAAQMMGKESALFVPSGTMSNNVAIMTHTRHGDTAIVDAESHIYYYESAAISGLAGVMPIVVDHPTGCPDPEQITYYLERNRNRFPKTSLLCLETTHNRRGGRPITLNRMKTVCQLAHQHQTSVHLDGARIFNAAEALGVSVKSITEHADSVSFCLSKGLSAPVGSILVGSNDFIQQAVQVRRRLGGGMRQSGVIAAAGLVALTKMVERLSEDHVHAQLIAKHLAEIEELELEPSHFPTNIVVFNSHKVGIAAPEFVEKAKKKGVKLSYFDTQQVRIVTNSDADHESIMHAIDILVRLINQTKNTSN